MLILSLTYVLLGFGALLALAAMILRIGTMMAKCPENVPGARAAAVAVATGYTAIGAGGVMLIGAILPLSNEAAAVGFFAALGFASLCLGLGFAHAVNTLRAVLRPMPAAKAA